MSLEVFLHAHSVGSRRGAHVALILWGEGMDRGLGWGDGEWGGRVVEGWRGGGDGVDWRLHRRVEEVGVSASVQFCRAFCFIAPCNQNAVVF